MVEEDFLDAFAEAVREQIGHTCDIVLDEVGTFEARHQKQHQQRYQDGRVVMLPPKDIIKFVPDSK